MYSLKILVGRYKWVIYDWFGLGEVEGIGNIKGKEDFWLFG